MRGQPWSEPRVWSPPGVTGWTVRRHAFFIPSLVAMLLPGSWKPHTAIRQEGEYIFPVITDPSLLPLRYPRPLTKWDSTFHLSSLCSYIFFNPSSFRCQVSSLKYRSLLQTLAKSTIMSMKPVFVATHPRACSTAFERVCRTIKLLMSGESCVLSEFAGLHDST